MNNIQKSFKAKSKLRCMADGGEVGQDPSLIPMPSVLAPMAAAPIAPVLPPPLAAAPSPVLSPYQKAGGVSAPGAASAASAASPVLSPYEKIAGRSALSAGTGLRRMASGGSVGGVGGPTSDTIPAMLSPGEFVLPADTVRAVGVGNLEGLRQATHTPVSTPVPPASGRVRRRPMANGGTAEEEAMRPGVRLDQNEQQKLRLGITRSATDGPPLPTVNPDLRRMKAASARASGGGDNWASALGGGIEQAAASTAGVAGAIGERIDRNNIAPITGPVHARETALANDPNVPLVERGIRHGKALGAGFAGLAERGYNIITGGAETGGVPISQQVQNAFATPEDRVTTATPAAPTPVRDVPAASNIQAVQEPSFEGMSRARNPDAASLSYGMDWKGQQSIDRYAPTPGNPSVPQGLRGAWNMDGPKTDMGNGIYGSSSKPGGPMDTFQGVGARDPLRGGAELGPDPGGRDRLAQDAAVAAMYPQKPTLRMPAGIPDRSSEIRSQYEATLAANKTAYQSPGAQGNRAGANAKAAQLMAEQLEGNQRNMATARGQDLNAQSNFAQTQAQLAQANRPVAARAEKAVDPNKAALVGSKALDSQFKMLNQTPEKLEVATRTYAANQALFNNADGTQMEDREIAQRSSDIAEMMEEVGLGGIAMGRINQGDGDVPGPADTGFMERLKQEGAGAAFGGFTAMPGSDDALLKFTTSTGLPFYVMPDKLKPKHRETAKWLQMRQREIDKQNAQGTK